MKEEEKKQFKPIEHRKDRNDIIQSYLITFARYGVMSIYEKKILYLMIADTQIQEAVRENYKEKNKSILFPNYIRYKMPLNMITENKGDYKDVKKAFVALAKRGIQYEDEKQWKFINGIIICPRIEKYEGVAYFDVPMEIYDLITNLREGYRQYNLKIALSLDTFFSMRLYEMISRQVENPVMNRPKKIETLKEELGIKGKYKDNSMFIKRVIEPSKKELDEKANYSFDYVLDKSFGSRKKDVIIFNIKHIQENEILNKDLLENTSKAITQNFMRISSDLYNLLLEYGFTEKGINANMFDFCYWEFQVKNEYGKRYFSKIEDKIKELYERALKKESTRNEPQKYIVGAIRRITQTETEIKRERAKQIFEAEHRQEPRTNTRNTEPGTTNQEHNHEQTINERTSFEDCMTIINEKYKNEDGDEPF